MTTSTSVWGLLVAIAVCGLAACGDSGGGGGDAMKQQFRQIYRSKMAVPVDPEEVRQDLPLEVRQPVWMRDTFVDISRQFTDVLVNGDDLSNETTTELQQAVDLAGEISVLWDEVAQAEQDGADQVVEVKQQRLRERMSELKAILKE